MTVFIALVPITILAVVGFVIFRVMRGQEAQLQEGHQKMVELNARIGRAAPASATVVESRSVATYASRGSAIIELRLEVEPPGGGTKYLATTKWEVDLVAMSRLQPGLPVSVKVDAQDRGKIYPAEGWAKPWGHWDDVKR